MPYSRIYLKSRFKMIWSWKIHVAILIFFPFVWQRCNLSNFDQLISTSSPNGIILNSSQINPPLSITETTYIGFCDAFPDSGLPIGFFRLTALGLSLISACLLASFSWPLWGFRWFQLAYWFLSVDCFGAFADFSLPIGFFRLTALTFSLILACLLASLGDRFEAFADSGLPIGLFWVTALGLSLISACLLVSFGWLLWGFRWFQLAYWLLSVDCFDVFANSSLPIVLLWLTALGTFSISACLSVFFGWLL